jgi:hypothetical protein
MQESDRVRARELLIKTKAFRVFSIIFAVLGLIIFLVIYAQYYGGDPLRAVQDPMIILIVILPFVPAFIFSNRAKKAEDSLKKLLTPPGK